MLNLAFVFSIMVSSSTLMSIILPAFLHFCPFIYTVFRVSKGRFLGAKRACSNKFSGGVAAPEYVLAVLHGENVVMASYCTWNISNQYT